MPIAGTTITIDATEGSDKITTTEKVTSPYFSNGEATLASGKIITSSLSDTNENYFFGISHEDTATTEEFNVTFGSINGYGAFTGSNKISRTKAIYSQFASILLAPTEVTGGFVISAGGTSGQLSARDEEIFVLSSRRSNQKDRLNKDTWLVTLSGSGAAGTAAADTLYLKDDSSTTEATATPAGDRYNIVSCSSDGGTITTAASVRNFGYFYPDLGVMVFSQAELSSSIPGKTVGADTVIGFTSASQNGFGVVDGAGTRHLDTKQALRFVNCVRSGSLKFRDEEDQVSAQYFCRVKSGHCNFSNNPTFVSGSENKLRNTKMRGNPQTFITAVQLYNDQDQMVAVANLSTPLKKNFSSEATIKVKLTY
jgi:hypothetical protein